MADVEHENQGVAGRKIAAPTQVWGRIVRGVVGLSGMRRHKLAGTRVLGDNIAGQRTDPLACK